MAVIPPLRQTWRGSLYAFVSLVLLAAGCSSPTSPTRTPTTPTTPPVVNPQPQLPLTISCPASVTVPSTTGAAVPVSFGPATSTGGVPVVQVSCTRPSGSQFAVGSTTVQCTATDAAIPPVSTSCQFTVTVTPPIPQLSRTKFLAFGDSTTAGEVALATSTRLYSGEQNFRLAVVPSLAYPTQLLAQLRARYTLQAGTLQVINSGKPGEWAEDGALRLPGVMSNGRPEAVLLLEGVNEIAALGAPGVQRASRAIDLMAKEIRGRGARAFIATLPPSRGAGLLKIPAALIEQLNALIRSTVRGEGAVLVDLHTVLSADVNRYIGADGLHPTEAGYQKIAETFFGAIRADLELVPR